MAADGRVEPMVLAVGSELPLVDFLPPRFDANRVLRAEMLGQELVLHGFRGLPEDGQRFAIADRDGQPRGGEAFPPVAVELDAANRGPFVLRQDPPGDAVAAVLARLPLEILHRDVFGPEAAALAGQEQGGVFASPAEGVDDVALPAGVDQAELRPHGRAVLADPLLPANVVGDRLEPGPQRRLEAGAFGRDVGQRPPGRVQREVRHVLLGVGAVIDFEAGEIVSEPRHRAQYKRFSWTSIMNVSTLASAGIFFRSSPFDRARTISTVISIALSSFSSCGSCCISASKAASSRKRRLNACCRAESSSVSNRCAQATRNPASIALRFFR